MGDLVRNDHVARTLRYSLVSTARTFIGFLYLIFGKPFINNGLTTFVFHEISDNPRAHASETKTYSDKKTFEAQINWIIQSFTVESLEANAGVAKKGRCVLSFDDGYLGVINNALPILEKYRVPAICFINMATIEGGLNPSALAMYLAKRAGRLVDWRDSNPRFFSESLSHMSTQELREVHDYQGPYMTEKELHILSENSLITIGDHLYNHWLLNELSQEELKMELDKNKERLEKYKSYKNYFAAPHGVATGDSIACLIQRQYKFFFAGKAVLNKGNLSILPRIDLNNEIASKQQFYGAIAISKMRGVRNAFLTR